MSIARGEAVGWTDVRDHVETPDGPQIGPGVSKEASPMLVECSHCFWVVCSKGWWESFIDPTVPPGLLLWDKQWAWFWDRAGDKVDSRPPRAHVIAPLWKWQRKKLLKYHYTSSRMTKKKIFELWNYQMLVGIQLGECENLGKQFGSFSQKWNIPLV